MVNSGFAVCVFTVAVFFETVSSSAIPMWEYLTPDEKIMYLYNMFQTQVRDYCETQACKQQLKNYAWNKLKGMPEDHLDKMDPFQKGSGDILWESVMEGHEMLENNSKPPSTTDGKHDDRLEETYVNEASAIFETTNTAPPNIYMIEVNKPQYNLREEYTASNGIQDSSSTTEAFAVADVYGEYQRIPLTGPMVVKVHVDGSPVKNDRDRTLPEDDDLKQYQLTKTVYQNL